jgi:chorismate mutase-like protein
MSGRDEFADLRAKIDAEDDKILRALTRRAKLVLRVAELKNAAGKPFHVPQREKDILARLKAQNQGPLSNAALETVYKEIIAANLALEAQITIAVAEADRSESAAMSYFGRPAKILRSPSVADSVAHLRAGNALYAVAKLVFTEDGHPRQLRLLLGGDLLLVGRFRHESDDYGVLGLALPGKGTANATLFALEIENRPGALNAVLATLLRDKLNVRELVMLKDDRADIFFVEIDGYYQDNRVVHALRKLRAECRRAEVVGGYPL